MLAHGSRRNAGVASHRGEIDLLTVGESRRGEKARKCSNVSHQPFGDNLFLEIRAHIRLQQFLRDWGSEDRW